MLHSTDQLKVLVEGRIDDLYAGARPQAAPPTHNRLATVVGAVRKPVGRALISVGVRIAGVERPQVQPPTPARYAA